MAEEETQQTIWNFDGAELYLIFQIKAQIVIALEKWDLHETYKKLRLLRMELDAKLIRERKKIIEEFEKEKNRGQPKKTEKEIVDFMLKELDDSYTIFSKKHSPENKEKSDFYQKLESFYMFLCYLMKKHGLYFREGEDTRLAVLRR